MKGMNQSWVNGLALSLTLGLGACGGGGSDPSPPRFSGFELKILFGSALEDFCEQAIEPFNQQSPKLSNGEAFWVSCDAAGSGDVVSRVLTLAEQLQKGQIDPESPDFPTLLSVDGEIYHSQLIYQMDQIFPGQNYIPEIIDAPLLTNSPMVFMTSDELAPSLRQSDNLYQALVTAETHQDLDPNSPPFTIHFVHTAPTRSNSGLQTLVTQFAAVSGKRPEELTLADVQQYQDQVQQIQNKVTRYGVSTSSLARGMVQNGIFWASVGSVYESSVIAANSDQQAGQTRYEAVYPPATFTSNMRAILPQAPWVSPEEQEAAEQVIDYLRQPDAQAIAAELGLRPGTPGVALGSKFSPEFGVDPQAQYDSYRVPDPEVVEAMLTSWQQVAKKASLVAIVVDSSGSMAGRKIRAVQQTLQTYMNNLGPKEQVVLIDFDSTIRQPLLVDSSPEGRNQAIQFIGNLEAEGGTSLYDATEAAHQWLRQNYRDNAINALLVLTDGNDSGSNTSLDQLTQILAETGFEEASDQRIAVFTVGYGQEGQFNADVLETMASQNGGYYSKGDPETIARLMERLQLEF